MRKRLSLSFAHLSCIKPNVNTLKLFSNAYPAGRHLLLLFLSIYISLPSYLSCTLSISSSHSPRNGFVSLPLLLSHLFIKCL
ncbi:hypothetical protein CsSME_00009063 [Camellia sinensis var. sinensis]